MAIKINYLLNFFSIFLPFTAEGILLFILYIILYSFNCFITIIIINKKFRINELVEKIFCNALVLVGISLNFVRKFSNKNFRRCQTSKKKLNKLIEI